ncbi:DUF4114 domain-containing protein [Nonlabens ulvanivorans]|uniref:DUF4114 domain-containing protein n=1 Tax=Nonlabens ulvanivorans TaxID=906888 RepID=UPI0037C7974A
MKKLLLGVFFLANIVLSQSYQYLGTYDSMGTPQYLVNPSDVVDTATMDMIGYSLPEGYPVPTYNPHYITSGYETDIIVESLADIWVTFVSEGAGYKNVLGFYTYDITNPPTTRPTASEITIIFPNVSALYSGGGLQTGDKVKIGTFPAGTGIGWVLLANAWNSSTAAVGTAQWDLFSNPSFNPEAQADLQYHNVLLQDPENERIILGFEDIRRDYGSCDNDFNDAIFYVTANLYTALKTSNYADISKSSTVSSGNTGGLESNGDLASLIAKRNFERTKRNFISNKETQTEFNQSEVLLKSGTNTAQLDSYLPLTGMYGTETAYVSTPQDLVNVTNAAEVFSVDYYEQNNRIAAVLATASTGSIYDHSKAICDRLNNSVLEDIRSVTVNGHKIISSKLVRASGETEYALGFSVKLGVNQNELFSFWEIGQYPSGDFYNFQIWGSSYSQVFALTNSILANLNQATPVISTPVANNIPPVFVSSGYYQDGQLHLELTNKTGATSINFNGDLATTEVSGRQAISQSINLSGNLHETISIQTGNLFDIGFSLSISNQQQDALYLADGPWGMDYLTDYASVSSFNVQNAQPSTTGNVHNIERNPTVQGTVKGNLNLFRHLLPGEQTLDVSTYTALQFDIINDQPVEIILVSETSIPWSDRFKFTIPANTSNTTYDIAFTDFVNSNGASFAHTDIKTIVFSIISDYSNTIPFSIDLNDVRLGDYQSTLSIENVEDEVLTLNNAPNPFTNSTTFQLPVESAVIEISVYDLYGRTVDYKSIKTTNGNVEFQYHSPDLKTGLYHFNVITDQGRKFTGKFLIN